MKLYVRAKANRDLDEIFEWIARDNRTAAVEMFRRIRERIVLLAESGLADSGRPGHVDGTRELTEYPYIIVYEPRRARDEIHVLSIIHMARSR